MTKQSMVGHLTLKVKTPFGPNDHVEKIKDDYSLKNK